MEEPYLPFTSLNGWYLAQDDPGDSDPPRAPAPPQAPAIGQLELPLSSAECDDGA